jgi:hypothetical protein
MVSTVRPRPNHYELLGLAPSASSEEIAQAFARQVSISRPMAETAQMSIAYETLRNPAKRRAYDASLGFGLMPQPVQSPAALTYSISAHFIGTAGGGWLDAEGERCPAEETRSRPPAEPEPFIAAAPTSPLHPAPGSEAPLQHPSQAEAERILQSKVHDFLASERVREDRSRDAEDRPAGWSRTGVAIGVILLVAALVGAWAGMDAGNAEEPKPAEHAAKAALAPPIPAANAIALSTPTPVPVTEAGQRPERRIERTKSSRQIAASKERVAAQSLDSGYYPSPSAETATVDASGVASAQTVAANLPIPNKVAARTIERLGYGCGEIASTTAVDGDAPGVYKVTCTSGQSYRAAPVRGRYRFRRLDH